MSAQQPSPETIAIDRLADPVADLVADLDAGERGFVLGWLLSHPTHRADAVAPLAPPSGPRCAEAVSAIAALARADRVRLMARLAREALAPIPCGASNVHRDTLGELLRSQSTETIQLIATDGPPAVRAACAEALEARSATGQAARPAAERATQRPWGVAADVVAELQRTVFAPLVAVPEPARDVVSDRFALRLATLTAPRILDELLSAGADVLGASLQGADDGTLRRAASHVAAPWSGRILEQARGGGAGREGARELVAATPAAADPLHTLARLGARAIGQRLGREDPNLVVPIAQRLPAELARELLAAAAE